MFKLKINSYFVKLCNKTCGTTRFRIQGFNLNLGRCSICTLRNDIGCCHSNILNYSNTCHFQVRYASFSHQNYIKIPLFTLPMIFIVQKLVQQVKNSFQSFIYFATAPNIRVKSVMSRRKNTFSERNLFYLKCVAV